MERPRNLPLDGSRRPRKSESLSPSSESEPKRFQDDIEQFDEISEYIKEVDEILDYLKPFPRSSETVADTSAAASSAEHRPGLDHLENLIRLVEQLKELRDKNIKSQQKTLHLKNLRLQRESKRRGRSTCNRLEDFILTEPLPPPPEPPRKYRSSMPFRKSTRSKSAGYDGVDSLLPSDSALPPRKSLTQGKAKISKWTKVKEAFRWERASSLDTKMKHSKLDKRIEGHKVIETAIEEETPEVAPHFGNLLQVPGEKTGDTPSPADSVLSGQISSCSSLNATVSSIQFPSSGYSGEHSASSTSVLDLPVPPTRSNFQDDSMSLSLQELSYSSDEDKFGDGHGHSFSDTLGRDLAATSQDEAMSGRSKSLDGETVLGPNCNLIQHLCKESLQESPKSLKQFKTPWGKVKDIIHTRKGSVKKKTKKKDDIKDESEELHDSAQFEGGIPSSFEETCKFQRPKIEVTVEQAPHYELHTPIRSDCSVRPLTPLFTLTLPSNEELQNVAKLETLGNKGSIDGSRCPDNENIDDMKGRSDVTTFSGKGSKWGKVKRAFLSGSTEEAGTTSGPSSPLHLGSFFSDIESDELSSGDWTEDKHIPDSNSDFTNAPILTIAMLKSEVQKNFNELQQKFCRDMEVEAGLVRPGSPKHDEKLTLGSTDKLNRKPRESLTIPLPTVDDLSPEFKKKLDEWKKIKKGPASTPTREENQSHFISKIGDWPKWRTSISGSHKSEMHSYKQDHNFQDEFNKKLDEWQMMKNAKRRSRSQSDRGREDCDVAPSSPGLSRKNSKRGLKKATNSGKSSGAESLSGSLREKEGRAGRKSQKEKDLQWLEKELHKIEREKLRLEREKEKFLEREARLEQMKRTMGTTSPTQEVLIQTATGFFRFEGISQKFTKKLYEWEKARGIAPEASTFALLESASVACGEERATLQRSKSVGSVIDTSAITQSIAHHPSSLSLNDVEDVLEESALIDTSRASSEPAMDCLDKEDNEPEAIIVDVEDVVEETASFMLDQPFVKGEVPIYSYAPAEVTQLIDSSGSDGEKEPNVHVLQVTAEMNVSATNYDDLQVMDIKFKETQSNSSQFGISNCSPKDDFTVEDGGECDKQSVQGALQKCQGDESAPTLSNVNGVLELSSELLTLSHKLEDALSEKSKETPLGFDKYSRRHVRINRIEGGKTWFSTDDAASTIVDSTQVSGPSNEDETVKELPSLITKKVLELKSGLSHMKQASAASALPSTIDEEPKTEEVSFTFHVPKKQDCQKNEEPSQISSTERVLTGSPTQPSTSVTNLSPNVDPDMQFVKKSPEVLKRKVKEKIMEMQRLSFDTRSRNQRNKSPPGRNDEETMEIAQSNIVVVEKPLRGSKIKRNLKTRRITDTTIAYRADIDQVKPLKKVEDELEDEVFEEDLSLRTSTPPHVFVATSRKIISPVETDTCSSVLSYVIDDIEGDGALKTDVKSLNEDRCSKKVKETNSDIDVKMKKCDETKPSHSFVGSVTGMPPLPSSPSTSRKLFQKETAPSIRMMIAKYNQKVTDGESELVGGGGTSSPGWRSPILDKRLKEQLEKFQQSGVEALRHGGKFIRNEVQKSASAGLIRNLEAKDHDLGASGKSPDECRTMCSKGILKSSSTGTMKVANAKADFSAHVDVAPRRHASESEKTDSETPLVSRALKIRLAKAEFLSRGPGGQSWTEGSQTFRSPTGFPWDISGPSGENDSETCRNRLSHVSVGSESSFEEMYEENSNLSKSASAGMIHSRSSDFARRGSQGDTEPACVQKIVGNPQPSGHFNPISKSSSSRFAISNIKSKFRRVKMRKAKEKESAVSALCRQSLFVDVSRSNEQSNAAATSKSCPSSPVLERGKEKGDDRRKWRKYPGNFFKS